jgi:hypothetical protein
VHIFKGGRGGGWVFVYRSHSMDSLLLSKIDNEFVNLCFFEFNSPNQVSGNVSGWGYASPTDMSILWDWKFAQIIHTNVFATYAYIQVVKLQINLQIH